MCSENYPKHDKNIIRDIHMYVVEYMLESVVTEKLVTDLALAVEIPGDILIRIRSWKSLFWLPLAKLSQYRI